MGFKIHVVPSGHDLEAEEGETLLDAAIREHHGFPYSCRDGICGTCKGTILEGSVDYGDYSPSALTDEEKAQGKALFCQARPLSDLRVAVYEINALEGQDVRKYRCRIEQMEKAAHDVMIMMLKLAGPRTRTLEFRAGQYLEFILKDGRRRSFSMANAPHASELIELHIRHVPGGSFTDYVFDEMKPKTLLQVRGPLGAFFLREDSDKPILFMAGGTGVAPVKGMVEHARHVGLKQPMTLYWGVRAKRDLYLDALLREWAECYENFTYIPVLSEPMAEDQWQGRTGLVHEAILQDYADLSPYDIYASGPPPMVYTAQEKFSKRGLPAEQYFSDAFEFQHH